MVMAPLRKMLFGLEKLDLEKEMKGRDVPPNVLKFVITNICYKRTNVMFSYLISVLKALFFYLEG